MTESNAQTREYTLLLVRAGSGFLPEFHDWLRDNWAIWLRFREEATKVLLLGRSHYSARTIGEFIRHQTALSEGGEFKINNNVFPDMARLYMATNPGARGLFELRGRG